jgi:hypothetical protein
MASTYSDSLKLELMETGANAATWGTNTNTNLEVLDAFAQGYVSKSVAGSTDVTLTTGNADPDAESANKVIELTGALTGAISVLIPAVTGGSEYLIYNNTSGAYALTIAATGHVANGVVVTQGAYSRVYCDGTPNFNVAVSTSLLGAVNTKGAFIADSTAEFNSTVSLDAGATVTAGQNLTAGSGAINLYSNGVATATTFSGSGASLTNLPAANLAGTIANISGANLTDLNASNVASGTLSNDRLDTVPTTKGGTGLTSLGTAGQVLTVTAPGTAVAYESISAGGSYAMTVFTSSGTYTKPAGLSDAKIRVLGGGGGGGWPHYTAGNHQSGPGGGGGYAEEYLDAPAISATETVTVGGGGAGGNQANPDASHNGATGGTSSFGSFVSASGGGGGGGASYFGNAQFGGGGAGGIGTGGQVNYGGLGGASNPTGGLGFGNTVMASRRNVSLAQPGNNAGTNSGVAATGQSSVPYPSQPGGQTGKSGAAGIVIVEEFS